MKYHNIFWWEIFFLNAWIECGHNQKNHDNNIKKNGKRDTTKEVNTTTLKCGGWRLDHFATKNITHEKVIQT